MPVTSTASVNDAINTVAVEVGLPASADPYSSTDQHYVQLKTLLQLVGEELCWLGDWEHLNREHSITTTGSDTGDYALPTDYLTMIPQTGWERDQNVPLQGPLSPQEWTYLLGRDLVSQTIYASFRLRSGQFSIFPQPPPVGLDINFEYRSKNWIEDTADPDNHISNMNAGSNIVLFDRTLVSRYLKVKYLEAKGFDSTKAQDDVNMMFGLVSPADKSAKIINAGRRNRGMPLLDSRYNTPDTKWGDWE